MPTERMIGTAQKPKDAKARVLDDDEVERLEDEQRELEEREKATR